MRPCPVCGGRQRRQVAQHSFQCCTPLRISASEKVGLTPLICGARYIDTGDHAEMTLRSLLGVL